MQTVCVVTTQASRAGGSCGSPPSANPRAVKLVVCFSEQALLWQRGTPSTKGRGGHLLPDGYAVGRREPVYVQGDDTSVEVTSTQADIDADMAS
jgi:hypothetical protein